MVSASIRRWWLLAAYFVTFMVSAAFMQSYTVFLVAFRSRGEASVAYAVSQFECRADQACDAGRLLTKIIVGAALGSVSKATNAFHAQWGNLQFVFAGATWCPERSPPAAERCSPVGEWEARSPPSRIVGCQTGNTSTPIRAPSMRVISRKMILVETALSSPVRQSFV